MRENERLKTQTLTLKELFYIKIDAGVFILLKKKIKRNSRKHGGICCPFLGETLKSLVIEALCYFF